MYDRPSSGGTWWELDVVPVAYTENAPFIMDEDVLVSFVVTGDRGAQGTEGQQGSTGTGAQGAQGLQGNQGFIGNQGIQGLQGHQGIQGDQGNQGIQGDVGTQGMQGNDGFGNQGIQGIYGNDGQLFASYYRDAEDASIMPSVIREDGYVFGDDYLTLFESI